ncbi:MAG TPA: hypothetical protein DCY36_01435 [Acidimicrobiaceae bacterium]|nr:hypothetical protein [Sphingomonadaceae bacterium]HAY64662.1 hypothetical protein [Acidimicrobiaceae bacterium]HCB79076.1 hypothetical protein [Erythrobacter sp.]|tara:strand:+ start:771 stop:1313 length:543 start_codon:yes stop_codon:yes gene_type:complete
MMRYLVLFVALICTEPFTATAQDSEPEVRAAPFGHRPWGQANPGQEPTQIGVTIEKDGEFFWRGQVDGRQDRIEIKSGFSENPGCIIVVRAFDGIAPSHTLANAGVPKLTINIRPYNSSAANPERFDFSFEYERSVLNGNPCHGQSDIRITKMSNRLYIKSGERVVLPPYSGFQITLERK